jgi:hypothetical protein
MNWFEKLNERDVLINIKYYAKNHFSCTDEK